MKPNREPLISVVLPTYNVAQYLRQCLESVAAQTYRNIEVIIIIDGATDGSYEIAQEFCKTDSRFAVYWQENAGSGPARNAGLAHCKGEFVMFVDPDDWIEPELLEKLYEAQQEGDYDLVASRRISVACDNDGNPIKIKYRHYKDETIIGKENVRKAYIKMLNNSVVGSPTQKLYKISLIKSHDVTFPNLRRSQDVVFNYRYYSFVESIRLLSYSGYNYRVMVMQAPSKSGQDYYKTIEWFYEDYQRLYKSWHLPFPEQEFCDFFFRARIYPNLQRHVAYGWPLGPLVNSVTIIHIADTAKPRKIYLIIVKSLLLKKKYHSLSAFLKLMMFVKQKAMTIARYGTIIRKGGNNR